jgi:hypothetical protein
MDPLLTSLMRRASFQKLSRQGGSQGDVDSCVGLSLLFRQILGEKLHLREAQKITGLISEPVGVKLLILELGIIPILAVWLIGIPYLHSVVVWYYFGWYGGNSFLKNWQKIMQELLFSSQGGLAALKRGTELPFSGKRGSPPKL